MSPEDPENQLIPSVQLLLPLLLHKLDPFLQCFPSAPVSQSDRKNQLLLVIQSDQSVL